MADGLRKLHFRDLLWFTIKTKFRIAFLSDETQVKNILRIIYFFFLAGIGLLYGYLFNVILTQSHKPGIEIKAKVVIILTALFVLIIRNYLPTFSSPSNLFSRIYPIKNFQKTVLNISSDLVTSVTIFMAGFFIPFTLMAHHYSIIDVLLLAVISMSVIFIDRGIRLMMEYGFSNNKKLIWGTLVMIALLVAFLTQLYWFYNQAFGLIWAGALFMMIISFGFSMWLEMSLEGTPKTQKIRSIKTDAPSIQMAFRHIYLRNKKFRRMILSLIIKGIFLYEIYLDKNQNSMFIVAFFASFLMSPAVVFSYASNNFFGHFKELWFGSRIYSNDSKMAFKLYLQSLLLPLVIDFAFTMIILAIAIYIGLLTPVWILCYFAQMILFVYLGFVISILKPIKITDRMSSSFRRTTSQLYSSLLLVFVIITGGIMYMYWYWALLFVVPVAAVIHYKAPSFYEANRHKIYSIIF